MVRRLGSRTPTARNSRKSRERGRRSRRHDELFFAAKTGVRWKCTLPPFLGWLHRVACGATTLGYADDTRRLPSNNEALPMDATIACPLCGSEHEGDVSRGQFFAIVCPKYGMLDLSRRAIVEFRRHPHRLVAARLLAAQAKAIRWTFRASYDVPGGLDMRAERNRPTPQ
jgi:hypothetical protein